MSKTAIRLQHNDEIAAEARGDSVHLHLGDAIISMNVEQADTLSAELDRTLRVWLRMKPAFTRRFVDQKGRPVASIAPGDWVLVGADEGDWQQVAAKVRGAVDSDFTFHDGSSITWLNDALVTTGKLVDECGGGDLPAEARSWDVVS